ncbi:hypothetical protein [Aurantiacibacter poecillastricola]|uniref:hypothetical protein n=1 Tax=Aurantiacibacter poecillastricola TaxID=3064385 RepID=UPI00273FA189|nr:hypothetical protein [Aurantiacibacter sp. 219JJ12-13]MDP5261440.1 hypothetical protein [Aurantiacibacter sp. 219JJ12-13]
MHRIAAALVVLALGACSGDDPAPEPVDLAQDESVQTPAPSPAPDPSPVATGDMEDPVGADGLRWVYKSAFRSALYGPPESEGVLAIACDTGPSGTQSIIVTLYDTAEEGGEQMLRFIGSDYDASVEMNAVRNELGPEYVWQGAVPPQAEGLQRAFTENEGPITVQPESGEALQVPPSEAVIRVFNACA